MIRLREEVVDSGWGKRVDTSTSCAASTGSDKLQSRGTYSLDPAVISEAGTYLNERQHEK